MNPAQKYQAKDLPFKKELTGISNRTMEIHHDKLYAGYVSKMNETAERIETLADDPTALDAANQSYSELRAAVNGNTFAINGVYLHEFYFFVLGGAGSPSGPLVTAIEEKWGSLERFVNLFSSIGMAVRGWVVLCWDLHMNDLRIYGCDAHNQGGIWGCIPLIVLDVYEHAYFIDFGSDRKKYIQEFWKNMNWDSANYLFERARAVRLA